MVTTDRFYRCEMFTDRFYRHELLVLPPATVSLFLRSMCLRYWPSNDLKKQNIVKGGLIYLYYGDIKTMRNSMESRIILMNMIMQIPGIIVDAFIVLHV
jgi:hypothetical protein